MRVVFGIGNPGGRYADTRHNLGFRVVDTLARTRLEPLPGLPAVAGLVMLEDEPVLLVQPLTYVNRCGSVLEALRREHELPLEHALVVVDDLALPVGRLRLRAGGSDGGHNGLRSIIDSLGTSDFPRLRLGIGDPGDLPAERYVLQPFPESEREVVARAVTQAAEAVPLWIRVGMEQAMAAVNRRDLDPGEGPA